MKSCICGGRNKKCPYCEGSGQALWSLNARDPARLHVRLLIDGRCPICGTTQRKLEKHLRNVHLGAFSTLPRGERRDTAHQVSASSSTHSSEMFPCPACNNTLKTEKKRAAHIRRVHNDLLLPAANIPSSLRRLRKPLPQRPRMKHESQSVWTVGGGLPDSNRSRH